MYREITFRSLIVLLLKNAKLIIVCALILALVFPAAGLTFRWDRDLDNVGVLNGEHDQAILEHEQNLQDARQLVQHLENQKSTYDDRNKNSILLSLDYHNVASVQQIFSVIASPLSVDDDLSEEVKIHMQIEAGNYISSLYKLQAESVDLYDICGEIVGIELDRYYFQEFITIRPSFFDYSIQINVMHSDLDIAENLVDTIFEFLTENVTKMYGEHQVKVIDRTAGYTKENSIMQYQWDFVSTYNSNANSLKNAQAALLALEESTPTPPSDTSTPRDPLRRGGMFAAMGGLLGAGGAALLVIVKYMLSKTVNSAYDFTGRYNLELLSILTPSRTDKYLFDSLIRRLEQDVPVPGMTSDDNLKMLVANLKAKLPQKDEPISLLLTGSLEKDELEHLKNSAAAFLPEDLHVEAGQDCTIYPDSMEKLIDAGAVVLVIKIGNSTFPQIDNQIEKIERLGIEILGAVAI